MGEQLRSLAKQTARKPGNSPITSRPPLIVVSLCHEADERAQQLAQFSGVGFKPAQSAQEATTNSQSKTASEDPLFELQVDRRKTVLQPLGYKSGPVGIDFSGGRNLYRLQHGGGRNQTLAKAAGITRGHSRPQIEAMRIVDATSGFLRDSWALAALGCHVTALERCTWLHWMQREALTSDVDPNDLEPNTKQQQDEQAEKVRLTKSRINASHADTITLFRRIAAEEVLPGELKPADVIYLDPMYPEKKKSAAVKKEMQALQQLLGPDLDSDELVKAAGFAAPKLGASRIVVKRPRNAPALATPDGCHTGQAISSENTRYDVYLCR